MDPYACPLYQALASAGPNAPEITVDNMSLISSLYLFSRGGVRIRTLCNTIVTNGDAFVTPTNMDKQFAWLTPQNNYSANYTGLVSSTGTYYAPAHSMNVVQNGAFRGGLEIQIPQYHNFHSRIVTDQQYCSTASGALAVINYNYITPQKNILRISSDDQNPITILRQASDDFQLGFFLGIPPIYTT